MGEALIQRSFAGGELAPGLLARADLAKYLSGLRTCRNFLVRRHGGVANRPGTYVVAETKDSGKAYLYAFDFPAAGKSTIIEAGDHYFRFHRNGVPLGVEIATPYPAGVWEDPDRACWSQQGFVLTITHGNYPPHELRYVDDATWTLTPIVIGPSLPPPASASATTGVTGARTIRYVVTAAAAETYEESHPSPVAEALSAGEPTPEAPHVISWPAVAGAVEYYIYGDAGDGNNTFGFLGTATGTLEFRDTGFVPDYSVTPPIPRPLFDAPLRYPLVNTVYQQRRVTAGSHLDREIIHASQVGFTTNFCIRSPLQDDDAVTFRMVGDTIQTVRHLINLRRLVVLTDLGGWFLEGDESGALLPTSINPRQHVWSGSAFVRPVVIGESILFVQARGAGLRDLRIDQSTIGFRGNDLTVYAAHLFNGYRIDRLTYAEVPDSIVWAVRSDGTLLGLTYLPEEEVWGWHRHDTVDGAFEDVCTIDEGEEDSVYVVVRREVHGDTKRFIERFASRIYQRLEDAYHVDCGVTAHDTDTVDGLDHLEGADVIALADGVVQGPFAVSGGQVTLGGTAAVAHVGLPITAQLETLTLDVAGSSLRDKRLLVTSVACIVERSVRNFAVGPAFEKLFPVRAERWDQRPWIDGRVELTVTGQYTEDGHVCVQHTEPTPLTVLAVLPHVTVGG